MSTAEPILTDHFRRLWQIETDPALSTETGDGTTDLRNAVRLSVAERLRWLEAREAARQSDPHARIFAEVVALSRALPRPRDMASHYNQARRALNQARDAYCEQKPNRACASLIHLAALALAWAEELGE